MAIKKIDLDKMNDLLAKGKNVSDLEKQFPAYKYWEIYWEVNNHSFLGKKRAITNRLNKLKATNNKAERIVLAGEAQAYLDELYAQLKKNSAMLIDIDKILQKK